MKHSSFFNLPALFFLDLVFKIKIDLTGRENLHITHQKKVLQTDQRYFAERKYVQINVPRIHKVRRGRRLEDFKSDGWGQKGPSTADEVTPHQSAPIITQKHMFHSLFPQIAITQTQPSLELL